MINISSSGSPLNIHNTNSQPVTIGNIAGSTSRTYIQSPIVTIASNCGGGSATNVQVSIGYSNITAGSTQIQIGSSNTSNTTIGIGNNTTSGTTAITIGSTANSTTTLNGTLSFANAPNLPSGTTLNSANIVTGSLPTSLHFGDSVSSTTYFGTAGNLYVINGITSPITIGGALSDETTAITTTGTKLTIVAPFAFTILTTKLPFWSCTTAPTTQYTLDIQTPPGTSIYSTKPTMNVSANYQIGGTLTGNTSVSVSQGQVIQFIVSGTIGAGMVGLKAVIFCN